jgi:hypothetical protein
MALPRPDRLALSCTIMGSQPAESPYNIDHGIVQVCTKANALAREAGMAIFVVLKRPGPPTREVLVNVDEILMVQPGQGTGSAILFGREHLISFEEDFATVIRRIQTGPYVQTAQPSTPK